MKVYFVTQKNMKDRITLKPRIPETALGHEGLVARICVSSSILGCMSAIGDNLHLGCKTYIYTCDVDPSELVQPDRKDVYDVDMTGELWLLTEKEFILHRIIKCSNMDSFCVSSKKCVRINNFKFEIIYTNNK